VKLLLSAVFICVTATGCIFVGRDI